MPMGRRSRWIARGWPSPTACISGVKWRSIKCRPRSTDSPLFGRRAVPLLLLALPLAATAGACDPARWRLDVVSYTQPLVIRVVTPEETRSWLISGSATILDSSSPPTGVVELLDPVSCVVYDRTNIPRESATIMPNPTTSEPPGYKIVLGPDASSEGKAAEPNFSGCQP